MKFRFSLPVLWVLVFTSGLWAGVVAGAVYTETNSKDGNAVLVFNRMEDGQLTGPVGEYSTGGKGTGAGLGSQGALAIDDANAFLFAVNAGSDTVSVFRIAESGVKLIGVFPSQGKNPISLTVKHDVLYVLNHGAGVGDNDTIAGFTVDEDGHLSPIVSGLHLSAGSVNPPQIGFNPDGNLLVVTEKATNNIDLFTLGSDGVASGPTVLSSSAQTPFGFAFGKRDQLIVSDAFGGAPGAGAVSSYVASADLRLQPVTRDSPDHQTAPCWIVLTSDGRYVYTTNTGSGSVSSYAVGFQGNPQLLNSVAANTGFGSSPIDAGTSNDSRYLYILTPGTERVQGFAIALDGSLTGLGVKASVPSSATGLVAR